jgi:hypothetical protein
MPTIRINSSGSVILKNGSPSCTCCEVCVPDVNTVYVEYMEDPYGFPSVAYFELSGSLNVGTFEGSGAALIYNGPDETPDLDQWVFVPPGDPFGSGSNVPRCDPQGSYNLGTLWIANVSFTPLP